MWLLEKGQFVSDIRLLLLDLPGPGVHGEFPWVPKPLCAQVVSRSEKSAVVSEPEDDGSGLRPPLAINRRSPGLLGHSFNTR